MSLNPSPASPQPLSVTLESVKPEPVKVKAEVVLPPMAAAGVKLATYVLMITSGAVLVLMLYLGSMEWLIARDITNAYQYSRNPNPLGSELYMLTRLEQFGAELASAAKAPTYAMPETSLQNAQAILKLIAELPSVAGSQKTRLAACVPLPTDADRTQKLNRCVSDLENIREAALDAANTRSNVQAANEAATKINEQRQNMHQFWVQAAQLLLLNLLLPLLTGLFGYIFGTTQARTASQPKD